MSFEKEIKDLLKDFSKDISLEIPPDPKLGDFAFPCFPLAKKLKKSPVEIAKDIASKLKPTKNIEKIVATGPYVNFFVKKENIAKTTLSKIFEEKDKYGQAKDKKKTYMVEYFHANTHKGVHIGHLRNISMGEAICRILEKDGYKIIRVNYQGDIGPHVAKCIWGYINLKEKEPKEKKGVWLGKIYALANKKAEDEEIREINNKLYAKDKELTEIWKKTRQYCLDDFQEFYKEFGVKFERLYFESEVEEPGKKIVLKMLKDGFAEKDQGAIIINMEKYDMGVYVLLTSDENALYSTKDIALAELKQKEFKFDKSIHITGAEQKLYFQQLFKTFEIIKSLMAKKSLHIPYGLVMLPEGKMSSREGTMVLFDDLRDKLFKAAEKAIKERHKNLSKKEIEERTKKIAYAALKFSMVMRENNKDIIFDWEKALDFEGETGPYIQYVYARCNSVLKKSKEKPTDDIDFNLLDTDKEKDLIMLLSKYPDIIKEATKYKPSIIARYLIELCQSFNNFYHDCPIIQDNKELEKARLLLVECVKTIVKNGLYLLGIEAPEEM